MADAGGEPAGDEDRRSNSRLLRLSAISSPDSVLQSPFTSVQDRTRSSILLRFLRCRAFPLARVVVADSAVADPAVGARIVVADPAVADPAVGARTIVADPAVADPAVGSRVVVAERPADPAVDARADLAVSRHAADAEASTACADPVIAPAPD